MAFMGMQDAFDFPFQPHKIFLKSHFMEPSFYKTCCRHASAFDKSSDMLPFLEGRTSVGWLAVVGLGLEVSFSLEMAGSQLCGGESDT